MATCKAGAGVDCPTSISVTPAGLMQLAYRLQPGTPYSYWSVCFTTTISASTPFSEFYAKETHDAQPKVVLDTVVIVSPFEEATSFSDYHCSQKQLRSTETVVVANIS